MGIVLCKNEMSDFSRVFRNFSEYIVKLKRSKGPRWDSLVNATKRSQDARGVY